MSVGLEVEDRYVEKTSREVTQANKANDREEDDGEEEIRDGGGYF